MRKKTKPENEPTTENDTTPAESHKPTVFEKAVEEARTRSDKIKYTNEMITRIMQDRSIPSDNKIDVIDQELIRDGRFSDEEIAAITEPKINDFNGKSYYGFGKLEEIKAEQLVKQREKQLERRQGSVSSHVEGLSQQTDGPSEGAAIG